MTDKETMAIKGFANELKEQFDHLMFVTGDEVKNRIDKLVEEKVGAEQCT